MNYSEYSHVALCHRMAAILDSNTLFEGLSEQEHAELQAIATELEGRVEAALGVSYEKLEPKHGEAYNRLEALKLEGVPVCDSVDHNAQDQYGCSNRKCWKHAKPRPRKHR